MLRARTLPGLGLVLLVGLSCHPATGNFLTPLAAQLSAAGAVRVDLQVGPVHVDGQVDGEGGGLEEGKR